jgi:hypothetical protein
VRHYTIKVMNGLATFTCQCCKYSVTTLDFSRQNGSRRTQAARAMNEHATTGQSKTLQARPNFKWQLQGGSDHNRGHRRRWRGRRRLRIGKSRMPVRAAVEKSHVFNRTSVTLLLSEFWVSTSHCAVCALPLRFISRQSAAGETPKWKHSSKPANRLISSLPR